AVSRSKGRFLECLAQAAEQCAPVGKILRPARYRKLVRELVLGVHGSAGCTLWGRVFEKALDHIVAFQRKGQRRSCVPCRIAVEDVESSRGRVLDRQERNSLQGGRVGYRRRYERKENSVRVLLAKIIIHSPTDIFVRLKDDAA